MTKLDGKSVSDEQARLSRDLAEQARDTDWRGSSFLQELFLGSTRVDLLPRIGHGSDRPEFRRLYDRLVRFLRTQVDPARIDETGEYPPHVIEGLREMGAFGLKTDPRYGGLGLTHQEYVEVMELLGSHCANVTALLSAHQSIGVPHPLALFGSEALKDKYLPRCARGVISAFALTEPAVGSDPARLATVARKSADGQHFVLDGKKLWCTNGTLAELVVVMARDPDTQRINCFVVETAWPGVCIEQRCHFMGLRALANAVMTFDSVQVPRENLIGNEGDGLRIALATLNTGRLAIPAATSGAAKVALEICRKWSSAREQWGHPIGEHEAIAHVLSELGSVAYAMETMARTVGALADMPDRDLRLEAAAAKEWCSQRGWELTDRALQVRGGRGYETERSLAERGEPAIGIERMFRDHRINRIFEGTSEIMHLFIAREALDKHLQIAGALVDPKQSVAQKLRALPKVVAFYAVWYPAQWLGALVPPRFAELGPLASHARFAARSSRRLALGIFHAMVRHGAGLERKQALLFRAVDIALELFALTTTIVRANGERDRDPRVVALAEVFACGARRRVAELLDRLSDSDDAARYRLGREILAGEHSWLEQGTIGVPYEIEDLVPETMESFFASRVTRAAEPPTRRAAGER